MTTETTDTSISQTCFACNKDFAGLSNSGGFIHDDIAVGPCCEEEGLETMRSCTEHKTIMCPAGVSFADFCTKNNVKNADHKVEYSDKEVKNLSDLLEEILEDTTFDEIVLGSIDKILGELNDEMPHSLVAKISMAKHTLVAFERAIRKIEMVPGTRPEHLVGAALAVITFMLSRIIKAYAIPEKRYEALDDFINQIHADAQDLLKQL